jgi:RNA polymerase sigma-70 factor, ECF subfamily
LCQVNDLAATKDAAQGATSTPDDLDQRLERHRAELTGYCYRMLGSAFEAEDAVQETMVRAWRGFDRFEGRAALRSWLYRIATNVCFDMLNGRQRRARPMDLGPASSADSVLRPGLPEATWIQPMPDSHILPSGDDPADVAVARESVRLAFVTALQHLPPRQRAVLILREVLRWPASDVAELLGTTVVSVNSALQRARSTLAATDPTESEPLEPADESQRELLARYVDAFERYDLDALVSLLREDATLSMPPYDLWLRGHDDITRWFLGQGIGCKGSRLVPTVANGMPAFGQYRLGSRGGHEPWALQVVEISGGRISGLSSFLDTERLFPLFGLPARLEPLAVGAARARAGSHDVDQPHQG